MATVISYGGGIQSTALVVLAMRERWPIDEIVHVDLLVKLIRDLPQHL